MNDTNKLRKIANISHKIWLVSTIIFVVSRIVALFL